MSDQENVHTAGGAKRGDQKPAYRLIPAVLLRGAGRAFGEGAAKYNEGLFETNWKKGNNQFYAEAFDHLIDHLYAWLTIKTDPALAETLNYDMSENHLEHAAANLGFLMYGEQMGFFNEARDPGAPGYQYPFVPEDIPDEVFKEKTISEMIVEEEPQSYYPTTQEGIDALKELKPGSVVRVKEEEPDKSIFERLVKRATGKLKLEAVE